MSILLHIPHSSVYIPASIRTSIVLSDEELERERFAVTDRYTDELFPSEYPRVVAPVSRLVCDVERFRDDKDEVMSRVGMGAVYTSTHQLGVLRQVNPIEREQILHEFYDPHHKALT